MLREIAVFPARNPEPFPAPSGPRGSIRAVVTAKSRPAAPGNPPVLVRRTGGSRQLSWDAPARRVLDGDGGFLRVIGGPGTGKSTLLAEVAAERIGARGVAPENVLVLTSGRQAAARMRAAITERLTAGSGLRTAQEPLVRTVHSYAYAVLGRQAQLAGEQPPGMLSGPQYDAWVRDLLAGDVEDGARNWPESLRGALPLEGFAQELRDLLTRAASWNVWPERLAELGRAHDRPEWVAAGRFGHQLDQVLSLAGSAPEASTVVNQARLALLDDPELLDAERQRVRYLLVDDAQQLDRQQFELLRLLGEPAAEFVLAGDPDQAVSTFRGADLGLFVELEPDRTEVLTTGRRLAPAVHSAVHRLARALPGSGPQRDSAPAESGEGAVQVRLFGTPAQEAAWVADQLRRAHLLDGVPWSDMAVLVRSARRSLPVLRRALLAAGVPIALPPNDVPLAQQTAVSPLLSVLWCAARPDELDADTAERLLLSPLGGVDPLEVRRLKRGLRRLEVAAGGDRSSGELLVEALRGVDPLAGLEESSARPARRLAALLATAREAVGAVDAGRKGVEEALWQVWTATGLAQRWSAASERGGISGAQADRDLDAVVALFDAAAEYDDRLPGSDVAGFVEELRRQRIAGSTLAPAAPAGEAVSVLTAHASAGREWEVVAIPGVQEGVWPDLRLRGSLLGTERLVDLVSGVDSAVSATAPLLAEERRLLLVAAGRARSRLLVSAVRGEDEQPSRFLDELEGVSTDAEEQRPVQPPQRGLVLAELVAELRGVVCDGEAKPARRERAAVQLARLAEAGVPGAHPDSWYGLPDSSTDRPLVEDGEAVRISPSTVEVLAKCPLRWMVQRHGGEDAAELASVTGTLVHSLVEQAARGADREQLRTALDRAWEHVDAGAPWFSRHERRRVEGMVEAFLGWLTSSRDELTQLGVERDLDLTVPGRDGGPALRLRGRVDRLEADPAGNPVVVDVKTSKSPVSAGEAAEHPQLAVYQLAAALGAFGEGAEPGGARLLYVAKPSRQGAWTERAQPGLDEERLRVWLDVVHQAGASSVGPAFLAAENSDCARCPAKPSCPVHPEGRQVGQ